MAGIDQLTLKQLTEDFEKTHPALKNFTKSAFSGIADDYLDPNTFSHFLSFKIGYMCAVIDRDSGSSVEKLPLIAAEIG